MQDKKTLRIWAKTFDKSRYSVQLAEQLKKTDVYKNSKNIMIFYPLPNEVNLLSLLKDKDKNFFLPKIFGRELLCCPYSETTQLQLFRFKTQEPTTKPVNKNVIDLVIVPALCCDKTNCRLGYGGGFYDRFLKDFLGKTAVCLPKDLIVETVFSEEHDIKVDYVLTV